ASFDLVYHRRPPLRSPLIRIYRKTFILSMLGFISDLSEVKQSPVTFAEYIQALINKIHAHPEVWDMATVFNT
ncbi:MAG: hypothetical protein IKF90_22225, partial [Parasporobacterium sp.]|nr:hypothetical protein [Parasporobacterium sp.]